MNNCRKTTGNSVECGTDDVLGNFYPVSSCPNVTEFLTILLYEIITIYLYINDAYSTHYFIFWEMI